MPMIKKQWTCSKRLQHVWAIWVDLGPPRNLSRATVRDSLLEVRFSQKLWCQKLESTWWSEATNWNQATAIQFALLRWEPSWWHGGSETLAREIQAASYDELQLRETTFVPRRPACVDPVLSFSFSCIFLFFSSFLFCSFSCTLPFSSRFFILFLLFLLPLFLFLFPQPSLLVCFCSLSSFFSSSSSLSLVSSSTSLVSSSVRNFLVKKRDYSSERYGNRKIH